MAPDVSTSIVRKDTFGERWRQRIVQQVFRNWQFSGGGDRPGYSVLMPVPSDLPVFTDLALRTLAGQSGANRNEILIIPDVPSKAFERHCRALIDRYEVSSVRFVKLPTTRKLLSGIANNPSTFHFSQLVTGLEAASSKYVLLHDADLFLARGNSLEKRFTYCRDANLSVFAVHPRRRKFTRDCHHLVATWEMFGKADWFRRFSPLDHKAQWRFVEGNWHHFDTTHWAQYNTDAGEIGSVEVAEKFVHFNQVISNYRRFARSPKDYPDSRFKLLLIRLLVDAVGDAGWTYVLPSLEKFVEALSGTGTTIRYNVGEIEEEYREFRSSIETLCSLELLDSREVESMRRGLERFDAKFDVAGLGLVASAATTQ